MPSKELRLNFASFCWLQFHSFVKEKAESICSTHSEALRWLCLMSNRVERTDPPWRSHVRTRQVVCVKFYTCVLHAFLSSSASIFTNEKHHEWKKKSWVKETGLTGWQKLKGHFSHEATASCDISRKGKPQLLQHWRILPFSSRWKVWKTGPLRRNTTDFQISEGTPSIAWILWVGGTGGDDVFEPLEGNN